MKLFRICLFVLSATSLAACHPGTPTAPVDNIATVNGTAISRDLFNFYVKNAAASQGKDPATFTQQQKEEMLDNFVKAELVVQQAEKNGILKDPQTANMIELSRLNAVQQAFSENFVKENKPTDEELKKEYDSDVAQMAHTEYHVAHILVPTADAAAKVIADLDKGAKFEELAKSASSDSSKAQGGDLGWQTPDRMVKPFSDAMVALKPGEYTHVSVQTQYGWHVIKLLETRPLAPPTFDSVKDRVGQIVLSKKYKAYVDGLLAKAQIDKKM
ncbi:MAG TPA: peptidylprolyl isomerase [Steroidobacteraceae bacterium]|nr:peptidylprolyl isomerase [Steroidobacteraceae bacterium]